LNKESHRALSYSILEMHCEIIVLLSALYEHILFSEYTPTPTRTTLYFSNHLIMTQGNTCTYINDLTNNIKSGDSISSSECLTSQYTH